MRSFYALGNLRVFPNIASCGEKKNVQFSFSKHWVKQYETLLYCRTSQSLSFLNICSNSLSSISQSYLTISLHNACKHPFNVDVYHFNAVVPRLKNFMNPVEFKKKKKSWGPTTHCQLFPIANKDV